VGIYLGYFVHGEYVCIPAGCCHASIISIIEWPKEINGVEKVFAGHCTGLSAQGELLSVLGEGFHQLASGSCIKL